MSDIKEIENFTPKPIHEFTTDDTIYIKKVTNGFPQRYLCQFVKFEKGMVYGIVLNIFVNPRTNSQEIGKEIHARIKNCYLHGPSSKSHWNICLWFKKIDGVWKAYVS